MSEQRRPPRASDSVPDLVLERYRLNELPPADAERIAALAATDASVRERLNALEQSDREIRERYAADAFVARARARVHERGQVRSLAWIAPVLAIAGVILLVVLMPEAPRPAADNPLLPGGRISDDRVKGTGPSLAVYRRTPDGSERLADGDVARPGDLIRIGYSAAGQTFGTIVSVDGRGGVTLHLPPDGSQAARLQGDRMVLLDQAYELDEAPYWERFYFVTSSQPFEVQPVLDAARRITPGADGWKAAQLPLGRGLEQTTFSLQKEARR